jgi:hypothetical protein
VGDLFDEFMKELRRRQAEASGRSAEGDKPDDADGDGDPDEDDPDDRPGAEDGAGDDDQDDRRTSTSETVPPAGDADDADAARTVHPPRHRPAHEAVAAAAVAVGDAVAGSAGGPRDERRRCVPDRHRGPDPSSPSSS